MAETPLQYDDIEDLRYNPFTNTYTPNTIGTGGVPAEVRTVPNSAPYIIKLYEAPQQNAPSTTQISIGATILTEVSSSVVPGDGRYRVIYYDELGMGQVEFNSAQAGQEVTIHYYGLGHLIQKISLDTRVPSTGDTTIAGNKTFSGNTIMNGSLAVNLSAAIAGYNLSVLGEQLGNDGAIIEIQSSWTNIYPASLFVKHKTSAEMAAGFGIKIRYKWEDATSGDIDCGAVGFARDGADNDSQFLVEIARGGLLFTGLIIDHDQNVDVPSGDLSVTGGIGDCTANGLATKRVTGNSSPPTDGELDADFSGVPVGFIGLSDNYMVWKRGGTDWMYSLFTACPA
jgi:hypothetical protein